MSRPAASITYRPQREPVHQGGAEVSVGADGIRRVVFATSVEVEEPPISINRAYSPFRGTLRLTKAGKAFKDLLAAAVASSTMDWKLAHESIYQFGGWSELAITLYFPNLRNRSWKPEGRTSKGEPQSPYRKKDASNYVKLIEDAVVKGSGIDDCNNLDITVQKRHDPERPRVKVVLATYVDDADNWVTLLDR
jgi:Holliday junction resolvase RusA-like endonuclease